MAMDGEKAMLVSKTESASKYCPFKFASDMASKLCENANCMAWQKLESPIKTFGEEIGYCGLAGKPSDIERR